MPDNFRFNFTSDKNLKEILDLAFSGSYSGHAVGYAIRTTKPLEKQHESEWGASPVVTRFILYKSESKKPDFVPFPFKIKSAQVADFVANWLKEVDYGPEPDHDGHNGRGFNVYNESW